MSQQYLIVRDLRPVAEAADYRAQVIIKGSEIRIIKAEMQHIPEPLLMLTPASPVIGPDCLDPESPLLAPGRYNLPILLHALAVGRPDAEQHLLGTVADLVQMHGASNVLAQLNHTETP